MHLTAKIRFSVEQADDCDYFFDLHSSQPPLRFVRLAPMTATTRYFSVGEARQAVKAMHAMASSIGELPAGIDCGPGAEINVVLRVLNHLLVNWAKNLPPRAAARRKTAGRLKAAHGYPQVLAVVMKKGAEALDFSQQLLPESWVTEDLSVGGCGAIVPAGTGELLREQPSANGSLYLLARRDVFSGREPVEASFGSKENPHATSDTGTC